MDDANEIADRMCDAYDGVADVDPTTTAHADGATSSSRATKTWLLQRDDAGEWKIARQMWNLRQRA